MKDHCSHLFVGFFLILLICSVPRSSMSQTPVDRLVDELDALSNVSFDNWKYTTRFTGDAEDIERYSRPDFDDSGWEDLSLDQSIYVDSCWIRKCITLPPLIAGHPVRDRIIFKLSVDDYGRRLRCTIP